MRILQIKIWGKSWDVFVWEDKDRYKHYDHIAWEEKDTFIYPCSTPQELLSNGSR